MLIGEKFPFALIGHKNTVSPNNEVLFNNADAVSRLVDRFFKKGHRKLGFFGGYKDQQHTVERFEGFRKTCEFLGLPVNDEWIKFGDFTMDSGSRFYHEIMRLTEHPTAVICGNDFIAAGVLKAASPEREKPLIEVTGFDDSVVAPLFNPPITTVRIPAMEMGKSAAEALLDMLNRNEFIFESRILECEIIGYDIGVNSQAKT